MLSLAFLSHRSRFLSRGACGDPLAGPAVPQRPHLLVGVEDGGAGLGQVHMPVAVLRLHHVPQVGDAAPLPVHHHTGDHGVRALTEQGEGYFVQ